MRTIVLAFFLLCAGAAQAQDRGEQYYNSSLGFLDLCVSEESASDEQGYVDKSASTFYVMGLLDMAEKFRFDGLVDLKLCLQDVEDVRDTLCIHLLQEEPETLQYQNTATALLAVMDSDYPCD